MLNPWINGPLKTPSSEEWYRSIWADQEPKDFVFAIDHAMGDTYLCITPVEYFKLYKRIFNDSLPITHILPDYLIEFEKSWFEASNMSITPVYYDLIMRGFRHCERFQEFCNNASSKEAYGN